MKRIVFAFIMGFATISMMGQSIVRNPNSGMEYGQQLDSIVAYDLDYGIRRSKHVFNYDQNGHMTLIVASELSPMYGTFGYTEKKTYTYDDNDHCLSYSRFTWQNGWVLLQKTDKTFNSLGECVFRRDYEYTSSGTYKYHKTEYVYENDNCTERTIHTAQTADTLWDPFNRLVWTYDDWGNCLQEITYLPDGDDWKLSTKTEHTYDDRHNLILSKSYHWDAEASLWIPYEGYASYEYNDANFLTRKYTCGSSASQETKYTYNDLNQVTMYSFCHTLPTFVNETDTIIYTYDEQDSLIIKYEKWFHHYNSPLEDQIIIYLTEYERDEQGRLILETAHRTLGNELQKYYKNEFSYDQQGRMDYKHCYDRAIGYDDWENYSVLSYEFNSDGTMQSISGGDYLFGGGVAPIYFAPQYESNAPIGNTLGAKEAWDGFVKYWKTYNSNMNLYGFAYYEINEFPIFDRLESIECQYLDQYTGENVHTNVVLYYSDYHVGLPETPENNSPNVFNIEGGLAVECEAPADIEVYDMLGRIVAQKRQATHGEFLLTTGVYVVKVDGAATKAVVR